MHKIFSSAILISHLTVKIRILRFKLQRLRNVHCTQLAVEHLHTNNHGHPGVDKLGGLWVLSPSGVQGHSPGGVWEQSPQKLPAYSENNAKYFVH